MVKNINSTEKENILIKAGEIFANFGYQKTSTNDIAKAMGKTKSYLYYYFKDKEEIFSEIIFKEAQKYLKLLTENINYTSSIEKNIETYILLRANYFSILSNKFSNLKGELLNFLPLIENIRIPFHNEEIELVFKILTENKISIDKNNLNYKKAEIIVNINKALEIPLFARNGIIENEFDINEFVNLIKDGLTNKKD